MKKKKYTNLIIKIASYLFAIILIAYTIKNGAETDYQELFYKIGNIATIIGVIVLIIAALCVGYKIITYLRNKNIVQQDNETTQKNKEE